MSLQAKIEAVIYASEEPVTLAQLVGLLGEEAQSELDARDSQQGMLGLEPAGEDEDALNAEVLEPNERRAEPPAESTSKEATAQAAAEPNAATQEAGEAAEQTPHAETDAGVDAANATSSEADEKRRARLRERSLREYFRELLDGLVASYASADRGLEIREVAGGYRLSTKPEYHDAVRGFAKSLKPPLKLSLQALETLAVVAYKQPVTAPEVSEIRGVDSAGVLGSLMARKLVATAGRKQVIGRPILYKTTKDFLMRFGLKDLNELPSIEEFERMAGELLDDEPVQEEIPMANTSQQAVHDDASSAPGKAGSAPLDELNSAPEPVTLLHPDTESLMSDDATDAEGAKHEQPADTSLAARAEAAEPERDEHEAQADGTP